MNLSEISSPRKGGDKVTCYTFLKVFCGEHENDRQTELVNETDIKS